MTFYHVRSVEPLCLSKTYCSSIEQVAKCIDAIVNETQRFRDSLWDEELEENDIPRSVLPKEIEKNIFITKLTVFGDKKPKIMKESLFSPPFERKLKYIITQQIKESNNV